MTNMEENFGTILTFVKTIFESAIRKMELAVALPSFILDSNLSTILTVDEMNIINDILFCNTESCSKRLLQSSDQCLTHIVSRNKESTILASSKKTEYIMSRFDYVVCEALKILDKHIDLLRVNICYNYISMSSALFLRHIRYFLEHLLYIMYLTSEQARRKELLCRKFWRDQKEFIEYITISIMDLEKQRADHKKMLENEVKQIKKNIIAISEIDKRCNEDILNTITKYEKKQLLLCKTWEIEQNEIQLALETAIQDFKSLKQVNTKLEQTIHERRSTVESELLAILAKYDAEIGGRYRMLEELAKTYKHDESKKHALEKEIKEQEPMYIICVERKDKIETPHLNILKQESSARIVQQ